MTAAHDGRRRIVAAADRVALALGVRPGQPLAEAQARLSDLLIEPADPAADAEALERLAIWCLHRYSPIVSANPPDGLLIDIAGASHLFGGEVAVLDDIRCRLTDAAITVGSGLADTVGAAHGLARFGRQADNIARSGDTVVAVRTLPIAALRLSAEILDRLHRLGFDTIGDLEATPRAPLARRFGPEPGQRLDQTFGRIAEIIQPVRTPELIHVRQVFPEPISNPETMARHTTKLVDSLCIALEQAGLGARRLDLVFHRVDAGIQAIRIGTAKPVRDPKRLTRLLVDGLEKVDPGFGVETMVLSAPFAEPLSYRQRNALDPETTADIAGLIDTLANRIGAEGIYRVAPFESDIPERSVRRVSPLEPPTNRDWSPLWPRPARLLAPPQPVETLALLPDQPPVHFIWKGVRRRVKRADGPERIFGEWWHHDTEITAVRDYFVVEDETGERFWLFRSGDGMDPKTGDLRWFIHGIFA